MPPWTMLITPLSQLLDKLIPDPDARAKAQAELRRAEHEADLETLRLAISADTSQNTINLQEASTPSLYVAGWRPFIGWVCGVAFAYHFIAQPLFVFVLTSTGHSLLLPRFDMETLSPVLMGMLGLGSLRTLEKIHGAA